MAVKRNESNLIEHEQIDTVKTLMEAPQLARIARLDESSNQVRGSVERNVLALPCSLNS